MWEIVNGEWTFGEWWYRSGVGWKFEPHADQAQNDDPLDYPDYDYDDPRDLD